MTTIAEKDHYLSINLDNELFGVSVHKVLEVLEKQHVTKVPNVPDYIKGVINFRGEILPVIEARQKFNMPDRGEDEKYVIIVLDLEFNEKKLMLGVIADSVKDVLELSAEQVKDIPEMGSSYNPEFLEGMVKMESGFLMLLNVDKVFSSEEINVINKAQMS